MPNRDLKLLIWGAVFAWVFAYIESSVVVYLRALYYPGGFHFPLVNMDRKLVAIEVGREVATLVLLYTWARVAGRTWTGVALWFFYLFGWWDLAYYGWLKVFLDWPAHWGTWDILFLIPLPWTGPVWSPALIAVGMVISCGWLLSREGQGRRVHWTRKELAGLLIATGILLGTFLCNADRLDRPEGELNFPVPGYVLGYGIAAVILSRKMIAQPENREAET
ncbi:MAG: hypothetical protein D6762_01755 [Candidatus Neomarinimicrobiota bacterium]|nr:MAG: hypothetical protein D6762_01755 [Candidatus Neomarinimicrobiota bacterium]